MGTQGLQLLSPRTAASSVTASSTEEKERGELGSPEDGWAVGIAIGRGRQTDGSSSITAIH